MDFGLGLVLSFTDNATVGINNASNSLMGLSQTAENALSSLNQMASLSALSDIAGNLGTSFSSAGESILSTLNQVIQEVNSTGQTLMYAENQLDALYANSSKTGKDVIGEIQEYAKTSMFEFENLIPAVTSLKSVGIEAFDSITSSTGNAKNNLLDYASALASFAPQMKNAYGTGINAAIGAMREYIAEGNKLSLKRGAGLDITQILGEDKGATIEDRTRQVADLIEQLGMMGMVEAMKNNPMTQLSNMGDTLFQFKGLVADSGVYQKFTDIIGKLAEYVMNISEAELESVAQVVGDALTTIMTPLEWVADKVLDIADGLRALVQTNPKLIKMITIGGAIVGVFLVLSGTVLKLTSTFAGLAGMIYLTNGAFGSFAKLFGLGIVKMLGAIVPLALAIGAVYYAWKTDFAGIKTLLTSFLNNIGEIIRLVIDAWDFNLSEENYERAIDLGILPLAEALLDLRYRFEFFKDGFIAGWTEIGNKVETIVSALLKPLQSLGLNDIADGLTNALQSILGSDTQSAFELGESFAKITGALSALLVGFMGFSKVSKIFSGIFAVIKPLFGLIMAHPIVALVVGLIGALALLYAKCEPFRDFVNELFGTIWGVLSSIIEPMKEVFSTILASAIPLVQNLVEAFKQFIPQVLSFVSKIGGLVSSVIGSIMNLIKGILPAVMNIMSTLMNTFITLMPTLMSIWSTIMGVIEAVIPIITELIDMLVPFIISFTNLIGELVSSILPIIVDLINEIVPLINGMISMIMPMLMDIVNSTMPLIASLLNVVMSIVQKLIPIITTVTSVVAKIIALVVKITAIIVPIITQIVQVIVTVLLPIIDAIVVAIGFVIDIILGIVQIVVDVISAIVTVVIGIIDVIVSILGAIVQAIMVVVGVIVGIVRTVIDTIVTIIKGIILTAQTVWDGIVNVFSGAITFFTGIFETIFDVVSGIFAKVGGVFTEVWNTIVTTFSTISDTISGAIKGAINTVLSGAIKIINGFIGAINTAISVINAIPGVEIKKLTKLEVPKLAEGGVVDKPTMSIIGEAGTEAVMPLENNTGWIGRLASMISTQMDNIRPTPTANSISRTNNNNHKQEYLTTNSTTNNQTIQGDTDNSVVFNEGAIQVNVQNASEEEARRFAKKVLEFIKRQQELDSMMSYA